MPCGFPYCGGNDCANCHKPAPPPLPAHLIWNEYTVPGWPKDVKTPKPAAPLPCCRLPKGRILFPEGQWQCKTCGHDTRAAGVGEVQPQQQKRRCLMRLADEYAQCWSASPLSEKTTAARRALREAVDAAVNQQLPTDKESLTDGVKEGGDGQQ